MGCHFSWSVFGGYVSRKHFFEIDRGDKHFVFLAPKHSKIKMNFMQIKITPVTPSHPRSMFWQFKDVVSEKTCLGRPGLNDVASCKLIIWYVGVQIHFWASRNMIKKKLEFYFSNYQNLPSIIHQGQLKVNRDHRSMNSCIVKIDHL